MGFRPNGQKKMKKKRRGQGRALHCAVQCTFNAVMALPLNQGAGVEPPVHRFPKTPGGGGGEAYPRKEVLGKTNRSGGD